MHHMRAPCVLVEPCVEAFTHKLVLSHHLAKIVTAAVYSDAQHIEEGVYGLKTRAHDLAQADAAARAA